MSAPPNGAPNGAGGSPRALAELVALADAPRDPAPALPALRYWTLGDAAADPDLMAPPAPVLAPLAYAGRVTVLSAREKMGKSTLTGQVVAALSHGRAFFAGPAPDAVGVLWYAVDEPLGDAVRRLLHADGDRDRIILTDERPSPAELRAKLAECGARLVVVDTLSELWRGAVEKDADAGQVAGFLRPYVDVARETGAALLFLYHTNKAGSEYRGSVALGATVDGVLTLRAARAGTLGAGGPVATGGDDDGEDDGEDDDGRRVLKGRTRWGLVRVRLSFDGERYALGDAPLSRRVRALRAIRDGLAGSGSALARVLGMQKAAGLALVVELRAAGLLMDGARLELTPFGEAEANGPALVGAPVGALGDVGAQSPPGSAPGSRSVAGLHAGTGAGTGAPSLAGTAEPAENGSGTGAGTAGEPGAARRPGTGSGVRAPGVPRREPVPSDAPVAGRVLGELQRTGRTLYRVQLVTKLGATPAAVDAACAELEAGGRIVTLADGAVRAVDLAPRAERSCPAPTVLATFGEDEADEAA